MALAQYLQFFINSFTLVRVKLSSTSILSCKINGHVYLERKDSQQTAVVQKKDNKARRQIDNQTDRQTARKVDR